MDQDEIKIDRYRGALRRSRNFIIGLATVGLALGALASQTASGSEATVQLFIEQQSALVLTNSTSTQGGQLPFSLQNEKAELLQALEDQGISVTASTTPDGIPNLLVTGKNAASVKRDIKRIETMWKEVHTSAVNEWITQLQGGLSQRITALETGLISAASSEPSSAELSALALKLAEAKANQGEATAYSETAAQRASASAGPITSSGIGLIPMALAGMLLFALTGVAIAFLRGTIDRRVRNVRQFSSAIPAVPTVFAHTDQSAGLLALSSLPAGSSLDSIAVLPVDTFSGSYATSLDLSAHGAAKATTLEPFTQIPPARQVLETATATVVLAAWGKSDLAAVLETVRYATATSTHPVGIVVVGTPPSEWTYAIS